MKKVFTGKTAFMIYSVLAAIALWAFAVYNQNPDSTKTIRNITAFYANTDALERANLVAIIQDRNPTIELRLKGRRLSLAKLDNKNISASITVPDMLPGTYDVPIDILLPIGDVTITDKNPYTVRVIVEPLKRIELPVEITKSGGGKDGDVFIKASVVPEKIEIWGPESIINRIASLQLAVNLDSLPNETQNEYTYKIIDQNGDEISDNPNIRTSASAVSILHTKYNTKNIGISVDYGNSKLPDGYTITEVNIKPEVVLLGSADDSINAVASVKTAPIDISEITESTKITVPLAIPNGIANVHDISAVEVSFTVGQVIEKPFVVRNISITNKRDDLNYTLMMDETFTVNISGTEDLLLNPNIAARIDAAGVEPGLRNIRVEFTTPKGVSVVGSHTVNMVVTSKQE